MPLVRSLISKYFTYYSKLIAITFSFSEIMLSCSYYTKKGLVYIVIIAPFSCQPSLYTEYIKLNIYSSCNI